MPVPTTEGYIIGATHASDGSGRVLIQSNRPGASDEILVPENAERFTREVRDATEKAVRDAGRFSEGANVRLAERPTDTYVVLGLVNGNPNNIACRSDSNGFVYFIPVRILEAY